MYLLLLLLLLLDDDDDDDDENSVSSSDGVLLGARKSREKREREIVIAKPNRIFDGAEDNEKKNFPK